MTAPSRPRKPRRPLHHKRQIETSFGFVGFGLRALQQNKSSRLLIARGDATSVASGLFVMRPSSTRKLVDNAESADPEAGALSKKVEKQVQAGFADERLRHAPSKLLVGLNHGVYSVTQKRVFPGELHPFNVEFRSIGCDASHRPMPARCAAAASWQSTSGDLSGGNFRTLISEIRRRNVILGRRRQVTLEEQGSITRIYFPYYTFAAYALVSYGNQVALRRSFMPLGCNLRKHLHFKNFSIPLYLK